MCLLAAIFLCGFSPQLCNTVIDFYRIVNARTPEVWFEIEDKNPTVDQGGIDYLITNGVKVHQFDPKFHKERTAANRDCQTHSSYRSLLFCFSAVVTGIGKTVDVAGATLYGNNGTEA